MPDPSVMPREVEETVEPDRPELTGREPPDALPQAISEHAPGAIPESALTNRPAAEIIEPVAEAEPVKSAPEKEKNEQIKKPKKKSASLGGPVGQAAGNAGRSSSGSSGAGVTSYSSRVLAHLRRHKRHPGGSARGTVRMVFVLGSNGSLRSVRITGGSGNTALDNAALAMVRRASPFPSFPAGIQKPSLTFSVPVRFSP